MNYEEREPYGMYRADSSSAIDASRKHGLRPKLMGAAIFTGDRS